MHVTIVASEPPLPLPGPDADRPTPDATTWRWAHEAQCAHSAQALATVLAPALQAQGSLVVELHGTLGAGKTTFARHLLRALGVQGRIKSPSYAVVEAYALPGQGQSAPAPMCWHFDFYRFADPSEWEDAGFRDLFSAPGLKLVEWPQKAAGLLPLPDIALHIGLLADDIRDVKCHSATLAGQHVLAAWLRVLAAPGPDALTGASGPDRSQPLQEAP